MSISLTTPSNLKSYSSGAVVTFFDHNSVSTTSTTFTVNQEPFYLEAYHLGLTDIVTVQMVTDPGATPSVDNYIPIKDLVQLTNVRTKLKIDYPGTYQLVYTGPGVAAILVKGFAGTMTHESTMEIADAIYSALVILGGSTGTVTATAPITVTGLGSVASPYVIDITAASNAEMEAAVSLNEINTVNLNHFISSITATSELRTGINAGMNVPGETCIGVNASTSQPVTANNGTYVGVGAGSGMGPINGVVCVGNNAGHNAVNADSVVFIGEQAGSFATTAFNCVSIGRNSLLQGRVTQGTFVGDICGALYSAAGPANCSRVTAVGSHAADSATSGSDCIFVGANAGLNETHTNVIVIASAGVAVNATANNQIVLGTSTQTQLITAGSVISAGIIAPSDIRLKKNIHSYTNGLDTIMSLDPVTFEWDEDKLKKSNVPYLKSDLDKEHCGLIAQQLQILIPTAVAESGPDNNLFVHYDRLIPYLIAAVKELSKEVTELKKRVG